MGLTKFLTAIYFTAGAGYSLYLWQERGFLIAILFFAIVYVINLIIQFLSTKTMSFFDKRNSSIYINEMTQTIPSYWNTIVVIFALVQLGILAVLIFLAFKP